jgi:molecular chaperone HscB
VNEAYRTLQNPLSRAVYLLHLRGIDVEAEGEGSSLGGAEGEVGKEADAELLMQVMEVREEVESAEDEEEVQRLRGVNEERVISVVERLERLWRELGDVEGEANGRAKEEEVLKKIKRACVELRYWSNVRDVLDAWEKGKRVELVH